EQRGLFSELAHKLEVHAQLEEEIFYPALRDHGWDTRVDEAVADHESVHRLLLQIEQAGPGSDPWAQGLEELKTKVERHVHEEESEFFPKAQATLTARAQEDLYQRMHVRKAELAGEGADSTPRGASGDDEAKGQAAEQAQEYGRKMRARGEAAFEQGAGAAANQTRRIADALHATSEHLARESQPGLARYLSDAADGLNRFSNRFTRGDVEGLLQEARDTAKRNPALLLGGAIAAGFLLTRFIRSTETPSSEVPAGTGTLYRAPSATPGASVRTATSAPPGTLQP
ncbi:MAG: hemerythrin domain-containing protein, partial [Nitrococcus sp.]|nr:hemerythrin domain-containing protein [Nitrococcus sp.]